MIYELRKLKKNIPTKDENDIITHVLESHTAAYYISSYTKEYCFYNIVNKCKHVSHLCYFHIQFDPITKEHDASIYNKDETHCIPYHGSSLLSNTCITRCLFGYDMYVGRVFHKSCMFHHNSNPNALGKTHAPPCTKGKRARTCFPIKCKLGGDRPHRPSLKHYKLLFYP